MGMTASSTPPKRQVDGPTNRPQIQPIAPTSAPNTRVANTVAVHDEPVFEYKKVKKRKLHLVRWTFMALGLVILLTGAWFGYKSIMAARKILVHNTGSGAPALKGNVSVSQLKGEGDGRINILVLGIGGQGHDGPNLSDTMMVWSLDPKTKDVAMLSIPRDLYVQIPGYGSSKINAANAYGGPALAEQVVEKVIGVPIHYYIVVDFSGFKQAVDAVGGVDINVTKALNDPLYPCDSENGKYCPIYFPVGMTHMDGKHALWYSRSRETTSDFDRAARQQQVIVALRAKALSISTLTNPAKISSLIDAVGGHVKTDLSLSDIEKLAGYAKDVDPTKVVNKVISAGADASGNDADLLVGGLDLVPGAGWIELPKLGTYMYRDIQDFVKNIFVDHYVVDENALIDVQNGSGITGLASQVVTSLKAAHYNVGAPTTASSHYSKTVIYDYTGGKKPYTINYLQTRFGVKAQVVTVTSPAPSGTVNPDIRIIIGSDYSPASGN